MSNWAYVAVAFTVVWAALVVYAVLLARRVAQAERVAAHLSAASTGKPAALDQDSVACDAPPVP